MQLTGKKSIRGALTAITAVLLGGSATPASETSKLESSILMYSEVDRVTAVEGLVSLTHAFKGDRLVNARLTLDGLTGASPNGATPSGHIQTFTRPSGNGSYTVKPGEIPLDDTFRDTRFSFDGSLTQPLNRVTSLVIGTHLSTEHDYSSFGANFGLTRDFDRKNTTLSASAAYSHDAISPEGGTPTPLASMAASTGDDDDDDKEDDEGHEGGSGKSKDVLDAVIGVTQVLDRQTVLRLNYSFNNSSGYLNDPYKFLSVVHGPSAAEPDEPGEPIDYVYESRPDSHTKNAIFAELRRYLAGHTVDLSYRYFWDDWGITSHTVDLYYRLPLKAGHALQPHLRWYRQTEADFYRTFLVDGSGLPANGTADYRLAPFHALTIGLQYFFPLAHGFHMNIGAEYYGQAGDLSPPVSLGILSRNDLFPKMDAVMARVGFGRDL